jgi:aspartyl-tRNA(Asn)/glutamyl-tRNA(Gln) amidotransferase subunit C
VKIDASLVSHVAKLASLELTPAESEVMSGQLTRIVEHFEALREVPDGLLEETGDAAPTPLAADAVRDNSPGPLVEANAPEFEHGHFVVPRVVARD